MPGLRGPSPLLRLQSDERLIALTRRGHHAAFETLCSRYQSRLLAFCRHLLAARVDAEDVLQEVLSAAFHAMLADERTINVRPWLYRIARNRSLNHLRRIQAVGVDSMDIHFSDNGASTADRVHEREQFRLLVGDIHELPETQRTALVLREMDALSYDQIAEAMETTVPSVKSLLVRARVSLAEAAEARMLSCEDVRYELGEAAEGLRRRPGALVRRHLRSCDRCTHFRSQLKETNKSLAAVLPIGGLALLKKLAILHVGHSASAGSSASSAGTSGTAAAVGSTAAAGTAAVGSGAGFVSAGIGAIASKAAAGLAAAALVTAGAVEGVPQPAPAHKPHSTSNDSADPAAPQTPARVYALPAPRIVVKTTKKPAPKPAPPKTAVQAKPATTPATSKPAVKPKLHHHAPPAGRNRTQTDPTVLPPPEATTAPTPTAADPPSSPPPTTTTTTTTTTSTDPTPPPTTTT